jgi:hypothetical protein
MYSRDSLFKQDGNSSPKPRSWLAFFILVQNRPCFIRITTKAGNKPHQIPATQVKGRGNLSLQQTRRVIGSVDVRFENRQWDRRDRHCYRHHRAAALAMENARPCRKPKLRQSEHHRDISAKISAKADVNELLKPLYRIGTHVAGNGYRNPVQKEESNDQKII